MIVQLKRIIKYFIHDNLKNEPHVYYRSCVFVGLILFLAIFTLVIELIIKILGLNNAPNLILPVIFFGLILYSLKKFGSLIISSNFLVFICFITLAPSVQETGGVLSDNLLWLIVSPLIALLFSNKKSGFFWLCCLLLFSTYLYLFGTTENQGQLFNQQVDITYYYISYSFLFLFIFGIVIIFEIGQSLIIKMLNEKKILLEQQKLEILQKNEELEIAQEQLQIKNAELEATQAKLIYTNGELENFAYAAAHDLKEPLRMIGMYTGLSKKRMVTIQDKPTIEYMSYVTEGIDRMQRLLDDLLQYSRTGKKQEDNKEIDLNTVLFIVVSNLLATMKDTQATIVINELPTIEGSMTEMIQLFQNLIANSIKFRKADVVPEIKITASDEGDNYLISLDDNGIGIKKEFHERVFAIFERLHSRSEFEGSGIGLATCKKIVAGAGGKIWLDSTEGKGTTFFFTFPKPCVN